MPFAQISLLRVFKIKGAATAAFLLVLLVAVLPFFFSGSASDLSPLQTASAVTSENEDGSACSPVENIVPKVALYGLTDTAALGDALSFVVNVSPLPPPGNECFDNITLAVHRSDGTVDLIGPFESDLNGSLTVTYKPEMMGSYTVTAFYGGQFFAEGNVTYLETESPVVTFGVGPSEAPASPAFLSPPATLFAAGARWAARNGTEALYVNWLDNFEAHHDSDGSSWGPYWGEEYMLDMKKTIIEVLKQQGFTVTCAGNVPYDISSYDLVVFEAYYAVEPSQTAMVRDYLNEGGGVIVLAGVPCYFSTYCKDMWPYMTGGQNLASLKDWFGSACYVNSGGKANLAVDNPFGTSLLARNDFFFIDAHGAAGVASPDSDAYVLARWEDGTVFAYSHEYGEGRVYYQAAINW